MFVADQFSQNEQSRDERRLHDVASAVIARKKRKINRFITRFTHISVYRWLGAYRFQDRAGLNRAIGKSYTIYIALAVTRMLYACNRVVRNNS